MLHTTRRIASSSPISVITKELSYASKQNTSSSSRASVQALRNSSCELAPTAEYTSENETDMITNPQREDKVDVSQMQVSFVASDVVVVLASFIPSSESNSSEFSADVLSKIAVVVSFSVAMSVVMRELV